jgi:ABC-type phosphate transport system auxiliary subunit
MQARQLILEADTGLARLFRLQRKRKQCSGQGHDHSTGPVDLITNLSERSRRLKTLLLTGRAVATLYAKDKVILAATALLASSHSSAFHRKGRRRIHTRAAGVPEPDR